jgi:hypothetical protein
VANGIERLVLGGDAAYLILSSIAVEVTIYGRCPHPASTARSRMTPELRLT